MNLVDICETFGAVLSIYVMFLLQMNASVEESRKKIWLVDSKVEELRKAKHKTFHWNYNFEASLFFVFFS